MKISSGFVYIWMDLKRKKFYIGSHSGSLDDGYIGSNKWLLNSYKARPETFKRRILEYYQEITRKELLDREQIWLSKIKYEELRIKYYNEKRVAAGGDIISDLSEERRLEHKRKSVAVRHKGLKKWRENNPDLVSKQAKHARSCVKNPFHPVLFGEDNGFYGKKHTEETKKIMSEKATLNPSKGMLGKKHSKETRKKVQLNNPNRKSIMTPFGYFESAEEFANIIKLVSANSLRTIIFECDIPITAHRAKRSPLFNENDIGKTPREIGYYPCKK